MYFGLNSKKDIYNDFTLPSSNSYSGQDFKILFYIPVRSLQHIARAYEAELKDELAEVINYFDSPDNKGKRGGQEIVDYFKTPFDQFKYENNLIQNEFTRIAKLLEAQKGSPNPVFPVVADSIQTISYQIHTRKSAVGALGHKYAKGYTAGQRVVAGSIIATVIDEHPFVKLIDQVNSMFNWEGKFEPQRLAEAKKIGISTQQQIQDYGASKKDNQLKNFSFNQELIPSSTLIDQLPALNCSIIGVNENGNAVHLMLMGMEFINDGGVISVQDILTENTCTYVARDIDIMRSLGTRGILKIPAFDRNVTASKYLSSNYMQARASFRRSAF